MGVIRCHLKELVYRKAIEDGKRIKLQDLAKVLGVTRDTIYNMANLNNYSIRSKHLVILCDYFDCTVGDILEYIPDSD